MYSGIVIANRTELVKVDSILLLFPPSKRGDSF